MLHKLKRQLIFYIINNTTSSCIKFFYIGILIGYIILTKIYNISNTINILLNKNK